MISRSSEPEVRLQGTFMNHIPEFGVDVKQLAPGKNVVIDGNTVGYPVRNLREIPTGNYYVQALLNVYTQFHRADGHIIWAHMDQWEGQNATISPGNLYSKPQRVHLDRNRSRTIHLKLSEVIPPVVEPADTDWVKHVKIQSERLTRFWGRPMYLGAVVLLPKDYAAKTDLYYPVIYQVGHFSLAAPWGFATQDTPQSLEDRELFRSNNWQTGYEVYKSWTSSPFPRVLTVTVQHPTPYSDDSYMVNSANTGPYADAILKELIPYVEEHFRIIQKSYARAVTGGSTGGWDALALQVFHPEFFGGAWIVNPDPVDLRSYFGRTDIYHDNNVFTLEESAASTSRLVDLFRLGSWMPMPDRIFCQDINGQPLLTVRQLLAMSQVHGGKALSAGVLDTDEAIRGPVGEDGYPRPLVDRKTGAIDHAVAVYWRDHNFDLSYYMRTHWSTLGPKLAGKLHFYSGDADNFALNVAMYRLENWLNDETAPVSDATFQYGRPMKGHIWVAMTQTELVNGIAAQVAANSPPGEARSWNEK